MKTIEFKDFDGAEVSLSHSSAVQEAYRIYLSGEGFEPYKHEKTGEDIPRCIHLTRNQAEILISGLKDLFADNE